MTFEAAAILDTLVSHSMAAGLFEQVNTHEPKSGPGNGLTTAIWADRLTSVDSSGLQSTCALIVFMQRIYTNMVQEPQDMIDPNMLNATDVLITAYSGDFKLSDKVRNIDLLGQTGIALGAQAGYINIDGKLYRVMDITIPIIVNDVWDQEA